MLDRFRAQFHSRRTLEKRISNPRDPNTPRELPRLSTCTWLLALVIVALPLASCAKKQGGGMGGGFKMPPMPVEVAEVKPQTVRDQFRALGSIESDEIVQVVSELSGVVKNIPFTEGTAVSKGALLAQLDARVYAAAAERAEAQREQAAANAARAKKLTEQGAIAQQQLDDARTAFKVAEANENEAKAQLDKCRIRAPFGGMVGRRRISPGAYVKNGDVITEIARVDEMKVSFAVPERYLGTLQRGVAVELTTPAYPDQRFMGKVSVVDPIVDPTSRTIQLVARIANPSHKLRPGMSGNVTVTFGERQRALAVPDEAVFAEGNQSYVYVVKPDSTVTRTPIQTGTRDSMRVEVLSGLDPGAVVVRAGHQKLFEGAKVMPVPDLDATSGGAGATAGASGVASATAGRGAAATDPSPASPKSASESHATTSRTSKPRASSTAAARDTSHHHRKQP
jgi:membrane fusion protein (multidrug efflux system)